ncbi:hypothetical protein GGH13_007857, partial [Coemansia sp. S155-1]
MTKRAAKHVLLSTVSDSTTRNEDPSCYASHSDITSAMPVPLQHEPAHLAVEPAEDDVVAVHAETPTRQYASINVVPPLHEYSRQTGVIAAVAAPIVSLTSPILHRASMDGPGVTAPLTGTHDPVESRSLASTTGSVHCDENMPFTYSGVFSPHGWPDGPSSNSAQVAAGNVLHGSANAIAAVTRLAGKRAAEGNIVVHGYSGLHEIGSLAPGRSHMSSALCADGLSSDEEDSGSQGDDDSDSDTESYEGLAVDDINETYDH